MTVGENIVRLRTARRWSQEELANRLGVSRQSVSKWETGASIPELDRLIELGDLFGIPLDALVGRQAEEDAPADGTARPTEEQPKQVLPSPVTTEAPTLPIRRVVGCILLGVGLLGCLLAAVAGSGLLIPGGYLLCCGALCLLFRHAGLVIGWITLLLLLLLLPLFTGIQPLAVWTFDFFRPPFSVQKLLALAIWLAALLLIGCTVRALRRHAGRK